MYAYPINSSDILCGSRNSAGTIITIPAGKMWCGSIMISASVTVLASGAPTVTIVGTDAIPATGTVVHRLAVNGLALTTATGNATIDLIAAAPEGNSVTLEFALGGASSAAAVCNGFVI